MPDLGSLGNLTYTYDAVGNRTKIGGTYARTGLPTALSSATYNAANRLTNWGGTTLTYDANGNLTNDGTKTYTWNTRNQLASMTGASFGYDALGRRVTKTIGSSTNFLYDGQNPVQALSGTTPTANLLTGLGIDQYFNRTDSSGTETLLTDPLNSTLALTDTAGTVQTEYTYEPFGKTTTTGMANSNSFQYTGRENDGMGLYYYRARYYSQTLQRFVSEDPIGFKGGINLYGYVENNPVRFRDPFGLWTLQLGIHGSGTLLGGTASGFAGLVIDDNGAVGTYWGYGFGEGQGQGVSGGGAVAISNASDICGVRGWFSNVSAGGGAGTGGTADFFTGPGDGPGGLVTGAGGTFGGSLGESSSLQRTNTFVNPLSGRKSCPP